MRILLSIIAALLSAGSAFAASREVHYAPPAAWVVAAPSPTTAAPTEGAPLQMIYTDAQTRLGKDSDDRYLAYRLKILRPEALSAGNFALSWSPSTDELIVHRLNIIRDGKTTDVLATEKFKVIQREDNLDYAMLDGALTATLQAAGVQVGDEIEFAITIKRRDPTLGERSQGALQLTPVGAPGAYRIRLSWPKTKAVRWRAAPDLGKLEPVLHGDEYLLTYELRDPASALATMGAPARYNVRRSLEYSGFASWAEVSKLLWPIYDKASVLSAGSPVRAEAARIAAATKDPGERAAAALRLVQDRVRYVYVGLGDGNYRPANADDTWTRRFGDCKAKSVLLLALLRELGIEAEAVLVNSRGGDGINERLPKLASFDHVLVRATVDGKAYWLDGTRMGDHTLSSLPDPTFVWALPLRNGPVELNPVKAQAPVLPQASTVLQVDASAGFDKPAKVKAEQVLRNDAAVGLKTSVAGLSPADVDRGFKAYWRDKYRWVEPTAVSWSYDENTKTLVLTMTGQGEPEWEGEDRRLDFGDLGVARPRPLKRPAEQDQTAPWTTDFPSYERSTTVFKLPPPPAKQHWAYRGKVLKEELGGVSYLRQSIFHDNTLLAVLAVRAVEPEISPAQAQDLNDRRLKFDNDVPMVYLEDGDAEWAATEKVTLKEVGPDAKLLMGMGASRLRAGRYDEAVAAADAALAIDPKMMAAIYVKAEALRLKGDFDAAVALGEKARTIEPGTPTDMMLVGILASAGRWNETLPILDKVAATHPKEPRVQLELVSRYISAGAGERGLALARQATQAEPADPGGWIALAQTEAIAGNLDAALLDVDKGIRLQPANDFGFALRADVLGRQGKLPEAMASIEEAWRLNPLSGTVLSKKALLLEQGGRGFEARALYDDWAKSDTSGMALNGACWNRGLANIELVKAEADCAAVVKQFPDVAQYWDSYALIALRDGRLKEAIGRYDRALKLKADLAPSLYGRGLTKLKAGDEAGGRADIAAANAITPRAGDELTKAGLTP